MDNTLLEKAVAFHGHLCPGLVIGLRAVEAVLQEPVLGKAPYGTLVCVMMLWSYPSPRGPKNALPI